MMPMRGLNEVATLKTSRMRLWLVTVCMFFLGFNVMGDLTQADLASEAKLPLHDTLTSTPKHA